MGRWPPHASVVQVNAEVRATVLHVAPIVAPPPGRVASDAFSMALSYKYAISHLVQIAPISMYPEPSRELQAAALLLPRRPEFSWARRRR